MASKAADPPDERITYVSLFLSIVALSLFIISGFQATKELTKDQDQVSSSFIWNFDPDTQVASLKPGVKMACIGTSLEECNALAGQGGGGLIVKKGIQIGQNLFQTDPGGKNLIIKQRAGKTLASINLVTGGINFGSSAEVETGFKMSGEPANSSYDTSVWSATSVIHLVEPNDPETIIGTISSVIHNAGISGLRLCPAFQGKPLPIVSSSCSVMTNLGPIVVGDASWSYIQAYTDDADVIVAGSTVSLDKPEPLQCAQIAVSEADMKDGLKSAYHLVRLVFSDNLCSSDSLNDVTIITKENSNLDSCQYQYAYYTFGPPQKLGVCRQDSGLSIIEYCNPSVVPSS